MSGPLKQRLIVGLNGTLEHYPRRHKPLDNPAPIVTVYGSGTGAGSIMAPISVALTAATATLDSVDTTIAANAAVGAFSATLTSIANVYIGDRYWMTNEKGQGEQVTVNGIDAATKIVYFPDALKFAYAAAGLLSTFEGLRMTVAVPLALLTTVVRDARMVWTYAYRTGELVHDVGYYDVVLQNADWPVNTEDIREAWPAFGDFAGDEVDWQRLVRGARKLLETSLEADRLYADMLRNPELAVQYLVAKAIERYVGSHASQMKGELDYWERQTRETHESIYKWFRLFKRSSDPLETVFFA